MSTRIRHLFVLFSGFTGCLFVVTAAFLIYDKFLSSSNNGFRIVNYTKNNIYIYSIISDIDYKRVNKQLLPSDRKTSENSILIDIRSGRGNKLFFIKTNADTFVCQMQINSGLSEILTSINDNGIKCSNYDLYKQFN